MKNNQERRNVQAQLRIQVVSVTALIIAFCLQFTIYLLSEPDIGGALKQVATWGCPMFLLAGLLGFSRSYYFLRMEFLMQGQSRLPKAASRSDDRERSRRIETELALKDSEERFRLMVEKAPIGIATVDTEGNIIDVNPENLKILGSPSVEATCTVNVLSFPPWVQAGIAEDFDNCLRNGVSGVFEQEYQTKWGKRLNLRYVLTPLMDSENRITGAISIMEDFTEYKKAREELSRLNKQRQKDAETKKLLLMEVNHRVKNNLTSIIGMLYVTRKFIRKLNSNEDYMLVLEALIGRIESMATVHEFLSESNWKPLSLKELTNRIINNCLSVLPQMARIKTEIIADDSISVSPKIAGNMGIIINELTTNTTKYALGNRLSASISVAITADGEQIEFSYHDDGPGFPDHILERDGFNTGMYLTETFVRDGLGGSLTLRNENGALSLIQFKNVP